MKKNFFIGIIIFIGLVIIEIIFSGLKFQDVTTYVIPLILIVFLAYIFAESEVEDKFIEQFAKANNYTYSKDAFTPFDNAYDYAHLFKLGHNNIAKDQVSGEYNGYPIRLYLYSYIVGNGRGAHTYNKTVFCLEFNTTMPDIVLTRKGATAPESMTVVKLEGDFNKYFTLHVPRGYEVEALEVFTPDVMAKLIDKAESLNLEISQDSLYIYCDGFIHNKEKLYTMYQLAKYLTDELGPVLAQMKPSLEATAEVKKEIS